MLTWSLPSWERLDAAWLLLVVPCLLVFWWYERRQRRRVLTSWGLGSFFATARRSRGGWLLLFSVLALVIAMMGPESGTETITPANQARDVFLIVDVSQSMLAEDQPPLSRLQRAQQAASDLVQFLMKNHGTTRLGLIVFAGQARVLCPPTDDLEHVTQLIRNLNTDSLGERGRVAEVQGVAIGTSFAQLREVLLQWAKAHPATSEFTTGIVMSDGDELSGTHAVELFPFPLYAYAIGDSLRDWPIPQNNGFLMSIDASTGVSQRVLTRRREDRLQPWVQASGGSVLIEDAGTLPLVRWYQSKVAGMPVRALQSQTRMMPINRDAWFISLAAIILLFELAVGGIRQRSW